MNKKNNSSKNNKPPSSSAHHLNNDLFASKLKLKLKKHYLKITATQTILFITGAFVSHDGWKDWKNYFENKGYTTLVPPWPFKDAPVDVLRKRPPNDTDLAALTLHQLVDHYVTIVKGLPQKPIVIGHSLGGLITQILVNRDLVAAGIAIHSAPPLGLFTPLRKTYLMSFKDWQYAFVNGMSLEEQKEAYESNAIPESKRVSRGGLTSAAKVDFEKMHVPLLLTAGDKDHIIPAHLNFRNYKKYKRNGSVLDYKVFPGRNHFVLGQSTWNEDADFIMNWINRHSAD